jgi:5'-nucleotidase
MLQSRPGRRARRRGEYLCRQGADSSIVNTHTPWAPLSACWQVMRILISNDDGYQAPGIVILAEALSRIADISVVAPERDRSGASNSLTLDQPLRPRRMDNGFVCVDGTPTDCVHLGITGLLPEEPDMVVSGINSGPNLGDDVIYSGTVAAAMEGRFLGLPAIAVSLVAGETPRYFDTAARVAVELVERLRSDPLPSDTILNVNVPDLPWEQIAGYEATRLGHRHKAEPVVKSADPRGRPIYWVGPAGAEQDAGPGTDFHAVRTSRVSVTPIQVDLTQYPALDKVAAWIGAR